MPERYTYSNVFRCGCSNGALRTQAWSIPFLCKRRRTGDLGGGVFRGSYRVWINIRACISRREYNAQERCCAQRYIRRITSISRPPPMQTTAWTRGLAREWGVPQGWGPHGKLAVFRCDTHVCRQVGVDVTHKKQSFAQRQIYSIPLNRGPRQCK